MHKQLMLLGFLLEGPRHGYELHRMVAAHGELYADLKKANVYYLLDRLAKDGHLKVKAEDGARGRRGERLIYALTAKGRRRFEELLRDVLGTFEPAHTGLEVAVVFINRLPPDEALAILERRREAVVARRARIAREFGDLARRRLPGRLAAEHILGAIDAELTWIDHALPRLRGEPA